MKQFSTPHAPFKQYSESAHRQFELLSSNGKADTEKNSYNRSQYDLQGVYYKAIFSCFSKKFNCNQGQRICIFIQNNLLVVK